MTEITSTDKKPWESKTIVVASVLGLCQIVAQFVPGASIVSDWVNAHGVVIGSAWAVLAIALRFITKDAISLRD